MLKTMFCRTGRTMTTWSCALLSLLVFVGLGFVLTILLEGSQAPSYAPQLYKMQSRIRAEAHHDNKEETENKIHTCSPRSKYVFIATHKTGTVTTSNVFQRYAIINKLAVLIPTEGNVLSWGVSPVEEDYIHTPDEQYDAMWNHFTYNKTWLRSRFPADTAYISIIREPSNQLRSATNYYYLPQLMKIRSKNPVKTFLENPWKYKKLSEAHFAYCNVTWDPSRNFMSFDLGYPAEGAEDKERAHKYIRELETDFTLVLLLDYLDESLVLLGRLMCWELQDILYVHKNNRHYSYKTYVPSQKELANLRRWKAVDYLLFDTFNASLWRKIAAQGKDFFDEVKHFKEVNTQVRTYCSERKKGEQNLTVAASKWSSQFEVDAEFCRIIRSVVRELLQPVQKGHERGRKLLSEKVNIKALINGQPTFKYTTERENYLHMAKSSRKTKSEGKIIKKKQNINEDTKKGGG